MENSIERKREMSLTPLVGKREMSLTPLVLTPLVFSALIGLPLLVGCNWLIEPEDLLFRAVYENREEDVAKILASGKVKRIDAEYNLCTSLHFAVKNGNASIVGRLISSGANVNSICSFSGFTPLYFAARFGRYDAAKVLIEYGADIDKEDSEFGFNPLIVALKHGHINVAKLLVESGADACAKRVNNRDALESAEAYGESGFTNWYKESGYANCISNGGK